MASKSTNKSGTTSGTKSRSTSAKSTATSGQTKRRTAGASAGTTSGSTGRKKKSSRKSSSVLHYELKLLALIGFTVLSGFSLHTHAAGIVGTWVRELYLGLFSAAGYVGPYFLFILVFFSINPNLKPVRRRYLFAASVLFLSIVLLVTAFGYDAYMTALKGRGFTLYQPNGMTYGYAEGILLRGGGLLGNLIGGTLIGFTGLVGGYLVALVMLAVSLMAGTDLSLEKIFKDTTSAAGTAAGKTREKIGEMDAAYKARREEALLMDDDVLAEEDFASSQPQDVNRGASWFSGRLFRSKDMTAYDSDNFLPPDDHVDRSPLVEKDQEKGYDMYEDDGALQTAQTTSSGADTVPATPAVEPIDRPYPFEVGMVHSAEPEAASTEPPATDPTGGRTLVAAGKLGSDAMTDVERGLLADAVLSSRIAAMSSRDIAFAGAVVDTEGVVASAPEDLLPGEHGLSGTTDPIQTVEPLDDEGMNDWRTKLSEMKAWSASRQTETEETSSEPEASLEETTLVDVDEALLETLPEIAIVEADTNPLDDLETDEIEAPIREAELDPASLPVENLRNTKPTTGKQLALEELDEAELDYEIHQSEAKIKAEYILPSYELLDPPKPQKGTDKKELFSKAQILEDTLKSFGVDAKVIQITRGPSITMFELQPSPGVKVSKIVGLSDDIALALAASQVRIIAPIPGKSAVGVEIPNDDTTLVSIREVLESDTFNAAESKLSFVLGKDIQGSSIVGDLAKMPHLLIAGSTGSGKSVCVNTFIASILFNATPDEVKFLMIDPKVVELSIYNGIPHLLLPVVTDPKKASVALNWAVQEMTRRYKLFADSSVRDVNSYNAKVADTGEEKLPKIVLIIDELADLMMVAPNQIEDSICRLAQMARAAGIHLLVATQRPSVDVITGLIKANIPSRIAFAVSSMTDSRTILDMGGAEKLLGKGDMLYYPVGMNKPQRIQGAFVSDAEVSRIVQYCSGQDHQPEYNTEILESAAAAESSSEADELLPDAIEIAVRNGQASASMLQRKFRIGYNRAARIVDQMEERGIIGPSLGSKPREVLMTESEWEELDFS